MSPRLVVATAARVLSQLRHDPRTVALLLVLPCALLVVLRFVFDAAPAVFDRVGPTLLGIFPFFVMFLVTSVATLRERTSGTLERLLTMPLAKADLLLGYAVAFSLVTVAQSLLAAGMALGLLGLDSQAAGWMVLVAVLAGLLGTALGLALSALASSEFQAVQLLPAVVVPQVLLCGLLVPRERMAGWLEVVSDVLPLSYVVSAMDRLGRGDTGGGLLVDLAVVAGCGVVALVLGAATLRRRTP